MTRLVALDRQSVLKVGLNPVPRLEDFLYPENAELFALMQQLPDESAQRSIYLWGESGVGKSHLLQGLCGRFHRLGHSAVYIPLGLAEIEPSILDGLENCRLICIDDVHSVFPDPGWETALFHFYNLLSERDGLLVLSGAMAPAGLALKLEDLRSRLSWGLVYQVKAIQEATKRDFLQLQARARGFEFPEKVADYVLRRYARDMHTLTDMLDRLDHASLAEQRKITIPFIKSLFSN